MGLILTLSFLKIIYITAFLRYFKVPFVMIAFPLFEVLGFTYNIYARPVLFDASYIYIEFCLYLISASVYAIFLSFLRLEEFKNIHVKVHYLLYFTYAASLLLIFKFLYQGDILSTLIYGESLRQDLSKNLAPVWILLQLLVLLPAFFIFRPHSFALLFFVLIHASFIALIGSRGLAISFLFIYLLVHRAKTVSSFFIVTFLACLLSLYSISRNTGAGFKILHEVLFRFDASWNFIYHMKLGNLQRLDLLDHVSRGVFGIIPKSLWEGKAELSSRLLQKILEGSLPMKYSATNYIDYYLYGPLFAVFALMVFLILARQSLQLLPQRWKCFFVLMNILNLDFAFEGFSGAKFQYVSLYLLILLILYLSLKIVSIGNYDDALAQGRCRNKSAI